MKSDSTLLSQYRDSSTELECDTRQPGNDANLNGEVRTVCIGIQSSAIRDGIQPSAIRIRQINNAVDLQLSDDEDNLITGSNETVYNDDIIEVINARVASASDEEDQRRKESRAVSEIRQYLFQQEVATIDATIIAPYQVQQIMIHLKNKLFLYACIIISLLCAICIMIFVPYHGTQNSLIAVRGSRDASSSPPLKHLSFTPSISRNKKYYDFFDTQIPPKTAGNFKNHDRASMTPSSLPPSIYPSLAPSIRRNTKYHDFFDTFKHYTPEDILRKPSSPQHRALLWLANDDNRTMFIFDPKLLERYALVTLFFATGGGEGSWHNNYNFLSDEDVCDWIAKPVLTYEVLDLRSSMMGASCYVSEGRSVTELALTSNNLVGTIPEELKLLTFLQSLGLFENLIHGTIPALSSFKNLRRINLALNLLTGSIPEFDNNLNLRIILITNNGLTGTIPESIRKLSDIRNLQLDKNKLNGSLPNWIGELKLLKYLSMSNNNFHQSKIPLSINNLHNLEYLDLSRTQLTGYIPITNNAFPKLEYFMLHDNLLSGTFPNNITTSTSIKEIILDRNLLTGQLSTQISMMSNCEVFSVKGNDFSGSVSPLLALKKLNILSIGSNKFSGTIPLEIGNLKELRTIGLDFNCFTGAIPTTFSKLSNLVSADLSNNQMFGDLTEICLKASDLEKFTSDCLSPANIICPCCTFCC